jgi:hypothetical protein
MQSGLGHSMSAYRGRWPKHKNLEIQNICLLLKFIHKLHTSSKIGDKISVCSNAWRYLMTLIQLYRDTTVVELGDGRSTCFWLDSWSGNKPLSTQFPALFPMYKTQMQR